MDALWGYLTALLTTLSLCITLLYIRWIYKYWERKNVPFLTPTFLIGNIDPLSIRKGFHSTMTEIYQNFKSSGHKYGGVFVSVRPVFIPVDLNLIKHIMIKDFQYFVDRGTYYNERTDPLSANLFNIEGDKWRSLRTRLSATFTSGKMKYMFQTVMDCAKELENETQKLYLNKQPINIKEVAALFTTNVIGSSAFGLDCNCFKNPNNKFRYYTKEFFDGGIFRVIRTFFTQSYPKLCKQLGVVVFSPESTKFYADVVKDVIHDRESHNLKKNDFIQLLLNIKNQKTDIETLTFNEIAAQSFVFFLAGFETSSSTMTFAFYEMAKNQEIQDKVREEVIRVMEKYDGKITYEAVMEMTYLNQVFDETLRKYPIVATLERVVTKDYQIPGEDLILEKGTKIFISLGGIHHDPEYYPDPEKFDPDRFSAENKLGRHACAYMPFGEGPRICIGMRFGTMQAKIGMAILLKDYKYTLHPTMTEFKLYNKSPLLAPVGEVLLNIERI